MLSAVIPRFASDPIERTMLVSREICRFLDGPWVNALEERKAGRLRADLEQFVVGGLITICMTPRMANIAYMARLDPVLNGAWDIRSRDPNPAIRIIGCFSEVDVFIGLAWDYRKNLQTEADWERIVQRCQSQWRMLFPAIKPHLGDEVHDYVSRNFLLE